MDAYRTFGISTTSTEIVLALFDPSQEKVERLLWLPLMKADELHYLSSEWRSASIRTVSDIYGSWEDLQGFFTSRPAETRHIFICLFIFSHSGPCTTCVFESSLTQPCQSVVISACCSTRTFKSLVNRHTSRTISSHLLTAIQSLTGGAEKGRGICFGWNYNKHCLPVCPAVLSLKERYWGRTVINTMEVSTPLFLNMCVKP